MELDQTTGTQLEEVLKRVPTPQQGMLNHSAESDMLLKMVHISAQPATSSQESTLQAAKSRTTNPTKHQHESMIMFDNIL